MDTRDHLLTYRFLQTWSIAITLELNGARKLNVALFWGVSEDKDNKTETMEVTLCSVKNLTESSR